MIEITYTQDEFEKLRTLAIEGCTDCGSCVIAKNFSRIYSGEPTCSTFGKDLAMFIICNGVERKYQSSL